jgi:ABC-type glycerol-3-phosphate transport system substrate-binding protein
MDIVKDAVALASQGATIGLPNRAPHPDAARVFLNWLLSGEGQIVAQKALAQRGVPSNSMRTDIPKADVPRREWRTEGVQYVEVEHPSVLDMRPIFKIIEEALREAGRK